MGTFISQIRVFEKNRPQNRSTIWLIRSKIEITSWLGGVCRQWRTWLGFEDVGTYVQKLDTDPKFYIDGHRDCVAHLWKCNACAYDVNCSYWYYYFNLFIRRYWFKMYAQSFKLNCFYLFFFKYLSLLKRRLSWSAIRNVFSKTRNIFLQRSGVKK